MGGAIAPEPEEAALLQDALPTACAEAARLIKEADVFLLFTGAGFSADSGLAVYGDVAKVRAYADRGLDYMDLCDPQLVFREPPTFWGFWGQCFNDYRRTAPHSGYQIINRWVDARFRTSALAAEIRSRLSTSAAIASEQTEARKPCSQLPEPYEILDYPGAFYIFTSNVDAHHYDWFPACEIRECHSNVECYQCAFGEHRCRSGIWRAPMDFRFNVELDSMLAFAGPAGMATQEENDASRKDENLDKPNIGLPSDEREDAPRVGAVVGSTRSTTLRYMPPALLPEHMTKKSFAGNHPVCPRCGGPARPAILMFGDRDQVEFNSQAKRWSNYLQLLGELVGESREPLRVVLLEIGAGGNVPTVRESSEQILQILVDGGADARLVRINPDFPLPDNTKNFGEEGPMAGRILSLMGRGSQCLDLMDAGMQ